MERIEQILFLVKTHSTGNPDEFAAKFGLSPRCIQYVLHGLRVNYNVDIRFNHDIDSFEFMNMERADQFNKWVKGFLEFHRTNAYQEKPPA